GIALGHVALPDLRGGGRRRAFHVEQILDGDRHAVERTAVVSGGELAIERPRLSPRLVGHHEDEGVEARLLGLDQTERVLRRLLAGDLARAQAAREILDRAHRFAWVLKSAARRAFVARASASRTVFSSGIPRVSASACAASSQLSTVMSSSPRWRRRRAAE